VAVSRAQPPSLGYHLSIRSVKEATMVDRGQGSAGDLRQMTMTAPEQPGNRPKSAIPVIDIGPYRAGLPNARESVAAELRHALEQVGFFVMVGHGVPQSLIDQTFSEARRFHDLPLAAKMALRMNEHNNGYMAMGRYAVWTSDVNANDKPDLNEAFFCKRERAADDPLLRSGRRFVGANRWPEDLPDFRERVLAYTREMDALSRRVLPLCAVALGLPPDYFDTAFAESQFSFRLSHYPPVAAEVNQFGIAPHTDSNFMTFLAQTDVPGLQVRLPSGEWTDVPYIPGSYAVNSGDMMHRWSNGRVKSTPHRAVPPVGRHRYAIPFFLGPHIDTVIECLPTCQGPGNPPRFPPITYEAYLTWWYDANYNPSVQNDDRAG
jgi:isopenicillin N synthase-like dioxygenase